MKPECYEYMICRPSSYSDADWTEEELNVLGNKGWELCGSTINIGMGNSPASNTYYFKRKCLTE